MDTDTDLPEFPDLHVGMSREDAIALRESFAPDERERIQRTVADLLDLLGKTHTLAVLSTFAFAAGSLRFSTTSGIVGDAIPLASARGSYWIAFGWECP